MAYRAHLLFLDKNFLAGLRLAKIYKSWLDRSRFQGHQSVALRYDYTDVGVKNKADLCIRIVPLTRLYSPLPFFPMKKIQNQVLFITHGLCL